MAIKSMWFPRCLELFIGRLVYYSQLLVLVSRTGQGIELMFLGIGLGD